MDQVKEELVRHAPTLYAVFDYYASLGSSSDFTTISFNSYKQCAYSAARLDCRPRTLQALSPPPSLPAVLADMALPVDRSPLIPSDPP